MNPVRNRLKYRIRRFSQTFDSRDAKLLKIQ